MKRYNKSMIQGPILSSVIFYTVPIILTSVLQLLFNAADLMIVGQFCGSTYVGAVGATGSVTNLIVNLFIGLSNGVGVTVAHAIGGRRDEEVRRTVHTALPVALIGSLVLTAAGIFLAEPMLRMMKTPDNVLPLSVKYMQIYFAGITFGLVYNFCASILRAAGDTKSPLIFLTIAGVVNVLLNIVFVTVFNMDVAGVALATVISQAVSAILVVIALMRRTDACRLMLRKMRIYKAQLLKIVRIGLPAGIQGSLFSISNVIIQSSINSFGDLMVSGNAAASNLEGFVYVILNAFHQTAVNYIGQNVGARQYDRVRRILWTCLGSVTVAGLSASLLVYGFGPWLLKIYITDSADAIAYGMTRLTCICLPYFLCGLMDVSTGALRGLGSSMAPMLISIIGVCGLRLAWIYTVFQIPKYHTPEYLFLSYAITWTVTFVAQMLTFFVVYRKRCRLTAMQ